MARKPEAVEIRHSRKCRLNHDGKTCSCAPSYRAKVWSARDGKHIKSRWFKGVDLAVSWRDDARRSLRKGMLRPTSAQTIEAAGQELLSGVRAGAILTKKKRRYKPSSIRKFEESLRLRINPEFGHLRLADLRQSELQDYVGRLIAEGLGPSAIRTTFLPLQVIYRLAMARGEVGYNPCAGLELPVAERTREVDAPIEEVEILLAALSESDRLLWTLFVKCGLRLGELQALRAHDVDREAGVLRVRGGYDREEKVFITPKGANGRPVPLISDVKTLLLDHLLKTGRRGKDLVFGRTAEQPFSEKSMRDRANRRWTKAGLTPMRPHDLRHLYGSYLLDAGVNIREVAEYIGHANPSTTLNVYAHVLKGAEAEAARKLETYLNRRTGTSHE